MHQKYQEQLKHEKKKIQNDETTYRVNLFNRETSFSFH